MQRGVDGREGGGEVDRVVLGLARSLRNATRG
jgi:hypothetical protein